VLRSSARFNAIPFQSVTKFGLLKLPYLALAANCAAAYRRMNHSVMPGKKLFEKLRMLSRVFKIVAHQLE
jgi:hypothetical protein